MPALRKKSLKLTMPRDPVSKQEAHKTRQGEADSYAIFLDLSQVTVSNLLGSCQETSFSVYSDVIRGHVLATFGLLLLISNFERPGVNCPSLPSLPVRTELDTKQ